MHKVLSVPFKVKEVGSDGVFAGYGSVFGNIDQGRDMVVNGAYAKSLARHVINGSMPLMLYSHSMQKEMGEWLEMKEDERGLFCRGKLWIDGPNPDPDALKAYRGMKKELSKMGLSIGYEIPEGGAEYIKDGGYWKLKELDLWEVSPTPFPMNELARVESVKSVNEIKTIKDFEKFLQTAGYSKSDAASIASRGYRNQGALARKDQEIIELLKINIKKMEA